MSEFRNQIATLTIDDEGHRNSELQQVLVAGYTALKWALPLQAADETLTEIEGIVAAASKEERPLCNILTAPPVCHVAGCKSSRAPAQDVVKTEGMTLSRIEAAFDEWRKTLRVVDRPSNLETFAQGYVAGWNAKEAAALSSDARATAHGKICASVADEFAAYEQTVIDRAKADEALSEAGRDRIVSSAESRKVAAEQIAYDIRALALTEGQPLSPGHVDLRAAILETAAGIADAIDSGRGNEKYIAQAIRDYAKNGYWVRDIASLQAPAHPSTDRGSAA